MEHAKLIRQACVLVKPDNQVLVVAGVRAFVCVRGRKEGERGKERDKERDRGRERRGNACDVGFPLFLSL